MADFYYNQGKRDIWASDIDGATLKIALLKSSYSPDKDADHFWSDISSHEASGTGYSAGGWTIDNLVASIDDANDRGVLDADDEANSAVTINDVRYLVVYRSTGTPSTSPLHRLIDPEQNVSVVVGTFTVQWHANGMAYIGE